MKKVLFHNAIHFVIRKGVFFVLFFFYSDAFSQDDLTINGSFSTLPAKVFAGNKAYSANLNEIPGWLTVNTSKTYSGDGRKLITSNNCLFFYSNKKQESYTYSILHWQYPICMLMDSLQKNCTYTIDITYSWTSSTYKKRKFGVAAITREQLENLLDFEAKNIPPDVYFLADKKAKKGWVDASASFQAKGGEEYILLGIMDEKSKHINPGSIMFTSVTLTPKDSCKHEPDCVHSLLDLEKNETERQVENSVNDTIVFNYKGNCIAPVNGFKSLEHKMNHYPNGSRLLVEVQVYWGNGVSEEQRDLIAQRRMQYIKQQCDSFARNRPHQYELRVIPQVHSAGKASVTFSLSEN